MTNTNTTETPAANAPNLNKEELTITINRAITRFIFKWVGILFIAWFLLNTSVFAVNVWSEIELDRVKNNHALCSTSIKDDAVNWHNVMIVVYWHIAPSGSYMAKTSFQTLFVTYQIYDICKVY